MTSSSLTRFAMAAASQRAKLFGVRVLFRGVELIIPQPSADPSLALAAGGYQESAVWRLRVPCSVQPAPLLKEVFTEIGTGRRFVVATCTVAAVGMPNAREHIVEARLA